MILSLSACLLFVQTSAPMLPAGVAPDFARKVIAIEQLLADQKFEEASKMLDKMPSAPLHVDWDDSAAPADKRSEYVHAREMAFRNWQRYFPGLETRVDSTAGLHIDFVTKNPVRPGSDLPMGVALEWQADALFAKIGLQRGKPLVESTASDIQNDVSRAVGVYLGVGVLPVGISPMSLIDQPLNRPLPVFKQQSEVAMANLGALDQLRAAAKTRQLLTPAKPSALVKANPINVGAVMKGEQQALQFEVSNPGNAPLALQVRGDCGCIALEPLHVLAPGESKTIHVNFDTSEGGGKVERHLFIATNDPENPFVTIPVNAEIVLPYSFIAPKGSVAVLNGPAATIDVYLTFNGVKPYDIRSVGTSGVNAAADYEPWEGTLADPASTDPAKPRKGYHLVVTVSGNLPPGRSPGTLFVSTTDKLFPVIQFPFFAQKGIVAMPDELFFGPLEGPRSSKLVITRPGKDFKVLGATSSSANLKVTVSPGQNGQEWILQAVYDGKAPVGDFSPVITVKTDDPKQPTIKIPVIGTVQ